jgi:CheY-like chemotaxis protein
MMPDMDGFEVCRRLKEDPETAHIAVIFLSALDDTADKIRGLELGAVDYVTKPFHPDEVAARVETHCKILAPGARAGQRNRQLELVRDRILHSMTEGVVGSMTGMAASALSIPPPSASWVRRHGRSSPANSRTGSRDAARSDQAHPLAASARGEQSI